MLIMKNNSKEFMIPYHLQKQRIDTWQAWFEKYSSTKNRFSDHWSMKVTLKVKFKVTVGFLVEKYISEGRRGGNQMLMLSRMADSLSHTLAIAGPRRLEVDKNLSEDKESYLKGIEIKNS
uniref:Uncharacterized protein n=1 Tax=Trichogramma kaykai TaxID=54128 RepID=A0ABD2WPT3_9HYME